MNPENQHAGDRRGEVTKMEPESFDLIEFQQKARELVDPRRLFELWEDVCRRYERGEIGTYEVDEMKEVIWPLLDALASIRRAVNDDAAASGGRGRRSRRTA
jgi:hypothetical protein